MEEDKKWLKLPRFPNEVETEAHSWPPRLALPCPPLCLQFRVTATSGW